MNECEGEHPHLACTPPPHQALDPLAALRTLAYQLALAFPQQLQVGERERERGAGGEARGAGGREGGWGMCLSVTARFPSPGIGAEEW